MDCHLAIAQDHQIAIHAVLFERFTYQVRIGGIVFGEQDKSGYRSLSGPLRLLCAGL